MLDFNCKDLIKNFVINLNHVIILFMETDPLSIILVKADSKGDRLLFRYPFDVENGAESGTQMKRKNPYSIVINEDLHECKCDKTSYIENGRLVDFSDEVLSSLFAVKQTLREKKFEVKTNDVRFVGHPSVLRQSYSKDETNILINIVFALRASANHSIVRCYHELSKRLAIALIHEENKCGYFTHEMKIMITAHDEFTRAEEEGLEDMESLENPFTVILEESSLGHDLRRIFEELHSQGFTQFRLNKTREISFCLPQKVHQLQNEAVRIDPETIDKCFERLRPYYGLFLLVDTKHLLRSLSPDASPSLAKLIKVYSPIKSFSTLSVDASLGLTEVLKLASDLVYWGKAIVIYPLCESNIYMVAPNAPVYRDSPLADKFKERFPQNSLFEELSEFNLPLSLKEKLSPLSVNHETDVQIIVWLLQNRLLIQLHMYVYFVPTSKGLYSPDSGDDDFDLSDLEKILGSNTNISIKSDDKKDSTGHLERNLSKTCLEELGSDKTSSPLSWTENSPRNPGLTQRKTTLPPGATQKDLQLLKTLVKKGYLEGSHHLEEIMYQENLKRSELLQLFDKFRDILITCETEDPTISIFYPHYYTRDS